MLEWLDHVANAAAPALLPVLSLLVGWGLNQVSEGRRDRRTRTALAADRLAARSEAAADKRAEFELRVLEELRPVLSRYGRAVGRFFVADLIIARRSGRKFGEQPIEDQELDEELRLSTVELSSLAQLVLRPDLRVSVDMVLALASSLSSPPTTIEEAQEQFDAFARQINRTAALIGVATRRLYEEP